MNVQHTMNATSWAASVLEAADETTAMLEKGADQDWTRNAAGLEWTCRSTLDHLALGVVDCLEGIRIAANILASAVREADGDVRAWHPWGDSDGPGFAAMGVVELLVHGMDISRGLGLDWRPPEHLCAPAVRRLFPEAPDGDDATETLLWCTGRADLPGHGRRDRWQWDGTVR